MILRQLEKYIHDIINAHTDEHVTDSLLSFSKFGDISTNISFQLAPLMKRSPSEIANIIKEEINIDFISDAEIMNNGFINMTFTNIALKEELLSIINEDDYGKGEKKESKVNIEFISANPTGPLVLVNARAGFTGALLKNMMEYCGYNVDSEFYINDGGNQIEMLGQSILFHISDSGPEAFPENGYRGGYIETIAMKIKDLLPDKKWSRENINLCAELGKEYIIEWQRKSLKMFSISFDNFIYETDIRDSGIIEEVIDIFRKADLIYEKDNAVYFASSRFMDDKDRVIIKSDKTYSYLLPDIAYHYSKIKRGYSIILDILGPDHHGYINRIKSAVRVLDENVSMDVIIAQLITLLKNGKKYEMSKRQGDFITMDELYDEIDPDVLKFIFLMRRLSQPLDFDIDEARKQTLDNPVYYVQYAHARICSVLDKADAYTCPEEINEQIFDIPEARNLIIKMMEFPSIIENAVSTFEIHRLANYLYDISGLLHKFYHNHRIITDNKQDTNSKIVLLFGVRAIIRRGLKMMNVNAKERMEESEIL